MNEDLDALLHVASTVAREAGELIIAGRAGASIAGTKSAAVDIVTQMDLEAEALITARLAALRPDDGILGEEGAASAGTSGITWIVDPIDGTVNYLYGLPHFAVSIAAVSGPPEPAQWTALVGAVCDGAGTLWSAARGQGATRDSRALPRRDGPDSASAAVDTTLLATGFQYIAQRRAQQGRVVSQLLPRVRDIRRLGACSVDLCLVAAGDIDAYFENGLKAWDFAAGALICEEVGVRVGAADGGPPHEASLIAAVPSVWEALRDAIVDAGGAAPWDTPGA